MKKYIVKGKSEKEIVEKTSSVLGVEPERLKFEVLNIKKGIFGKINEIEMKIWAEEIVEEKEEEEKEIENVEVVKNEKERNVSEYFKIEINKNGVFGMIADGIEFKDSEFNKILLEMFFYLEKREIKDVNKDAVRNILIQKSQEPVKIAEYIDNYYIDGEFSIGISEDKMEGWIEIYKPIRGNNVSYEEIVRAIEKAAIKVEKDFEIIKDALEKNIYDRKIIIARGIQPQNGKDGEVEYKIDTDVSPKFYIDDMGRVDYKTIINSIKNVSMGEIVAIKTPNTAGVDGVNIFGEVIKAQPGLEKRFAKGDNVIEGMDPNELISMIDGRVTIKNGEINVYPVLEVAGDVELKNKGNIDFFGVVIIKGNVRDGFRVKAKGDVIVEGVVEDAVVTSGGNIFVKNGILGKENGTGRIEAEGSVNSKFIQNMRVIAKKNVEVLEHMLNSFVEADEAVLAINGKGKIIGGRIVAGRKVAVREAGNAYGTKTEIEIGVTEHTYSEKIKIDTEYNSKVDELEKVEFGLRKILDNLYWKNPEFDKAKYINELKKEIVKLSEEKYEIDEKIKKSRKGEIFIRDTMYRGVILKIDGIQKINSNESFSYVRFYLNEKKDITIGSFDEDDSK